MTNNSLKEYGVRPQKIKAVLYDGSIESKEAILKLQKELILLFESDNELTIRTPNHVLIVDKGFYVFKEAGNDVICACQADFFNRMFIEL